MEHKIKIEIIEDETEKQKKNIYILLLGYIIVFAGGILIYHFNFLETNIMFATGDVFIQCIMYISFPIFYFTGFKKKLLSKFLFFYFVVFFNTLLIREKVISEYFAGIYLISWIILGDTIKHHPDLKKYLFLSKENLLKNIFYGLFFSILIIIHLIISVKMAKEFYFKFIGYEKFTYWFFYGLALSSLGEELFFRALLFGEFQRLNTGFWFSSLTSSLFFTSRYLASPDALINPLLTFGLIFYSFVGGILSCFILNKTKSIIPCIIFNFTFNTLANFVSFEPL